MKLTGKRRAVPMEKSCTDCRFMDPEGASASNVDGGFCRYNAPTPHPLHVQHGWQDAVWPEVTKHDWCGKWAKRGRPVE